MNWKKFPPLVRACTIALPIFTCVILFCVLTTLFASISEEEHQQKTENQEQDQGGEEEVKGDDIQLYEVTSIVDGDTFKINFEGEEDTVRLVGIDTPEKDQCFSEEATNKLTELLQNRKIYFEYDTKQMQRDQYGRFLLYVWINDSDTFVNEYLVKEGYAYAYRKIDSKLLNKFTKLEEEAKSSNKGLWGNTCKCADKQDQEESRECSGCNEATVNYYNWDCSTYSKVTKDTSCANQCPSSKLKTSEPTPIPTPKSSPTPAPKPIPTCKYSCTGPDRDCSDFSTQAEAQTFFNCCGFT